MAFPVRMPTKGEGFCHNISRPQPDLCKTIVKLGIRIIKSHLIFLLYKSCGLIALCKYPKVGLIVIGEVFRRFIGRTIDKGIRIDFIISGGDKKLLRGQHGGYEHAIHSLRVTFK